MRCPGICQNKFPLRTMQIENASAFEIGWFRLCFCESGERRRRRKCVPERQYGDAKRVAPTSKVIMRRAYIRMPNRLFGDVGQARALLHLDRAFVANCEYGSFRHRFENDPIWHAVLNRPKSLEMSRNDTVRGVGFWCDGDGFFFVSCGARRRSIDRTATLCACHRAQMSRAICEPQRAFEVAFFATSIRALASRGGS
jgi:hypothetical protein